MHKIFFLLELKTKNNYKYFIFKDTIETCTCNAAYDDNTSLIAGNTRSQ